MTKRYFTLLSRDDKTAPWGIEFGDYSHACVYSEMEDFLDHDYKRSNLKIIETDETQASIDEAVAKLNRR